MGRYLDRITERFHRQEQKGILKYGQPLEENHGTISYRMEHLAQELTDGLMYVEWVKEGAHIAVKMFEMLAGAVEKMEACPLEKSCSPEHLPDGGCVACLEEHYEKEARAIIGC